MCRARNLGRLVEHRDRKGGQIDASRRLWSDSACVRPACMMSEVAEQPFV